MGEGYFVIGCTADGLTLHGPLTAKELQERLASGYYGERRTRFCDLVPRVDGFCPVMEDEELLIIRGAIVQPKVVETATRWELP